MGTGRCGTDAGNNHERLCLLERHSFRSIGKGADMKKVQSTCNYCALDCNLDFYVENDRIVKVVPTPGYPVNDGFSCIKGLSLDKQQTTVKPNSLPKISFTSHASVLSSTS